MVPTSATAIACSACCRAACIMPPHIDQAMKRFYGFRVMHNKEYDQPRVHVAWTDWSLEIEHVLEWPSKGGMKLNWRRLLRYFYNGCGQHTHMNGSETDIAQLLQGRTSHSSSPISQSELTVDSMDMNT